LSGVNDPPVADNDTATTPRGTDVIIPVLANDTDVDGTIVGSTVTVTVVPGDGTATANGDGTITFVPPAATSGLFTFKYTVDDNSTATSNEATVTVLVNDPPVAADDVVTAILDVQNTASEFDILANDTDTEGGLDPSTVTIVQGVDPTKGVIEEIKADGTVVYRPLSTVSTPTVDSFTYTVSDTDGAISTPATVTINIIEDPAPWQNKLNPLDVNGDTVVSPIDALLIITYLNDNGPGTLPAPGGSFQPPPFLDPTGDNQVNPTDVLQIINFLNANASGEGEEAEGEGADMSWQQEATSQLDVGVMLPGDSGLATSLARFSLDSTSSQQHVDRPSTASATAIDAAQAASSKVAESSQYQADKVANSNRRADGLKIADSESLEDLLDLIADDLADVGDSTAHDVAIDQWLNRYLDD